jgi:hypothetical protein
MMHFYLFFTSAILKSTRLAHLRNWRSLNGIKTAALRWNLVSQCGRAILPGIDLTALFFNLTVAWDKLARCAVGNFDGGSGWI